jgi:hypothetical protein
MHADAAAPDWHGDARCAKLCIVGVIAGGDEMDAHSPEPLPQVTADQLPGAWPPSLSIPGLEPLPGPDEPPVRLADLPPNTPVPGTTADARR